MSHKLRVLNINADTLDAAAMRQPHGRAAHPLTVGEAQSGVPAG